MPTNEIQEVENPINLIDELISKEYVKLYDYKCFNNIQEIGSENFGKVFRSNWKNLEQHVTLKPFALNNDAVREIVHELKLQRDVDFHNNIRIYGITKVESDNQLKNYSLVMEYADGGTLRDYLKKSFSGLTWSDKYNLAYQLACAASCLHNEGIVHKDLHSCNILVHQEHIRLADFGLSKRIEEASNPQTKLKSFETLPYIDPKSFAKRRNNSPVYSLNEKSDVYSVGVLLWEISSGRPPFESEHDIGLALEIAQGLRETPISNTSEDYINIYTECWDIEPDHRPTIFEVVAKLKTIITKTSISDQNNNFELNISKQEFNSNNIIHEEIVQNIDKMNTNDAELVISSASEQIISKDDLPEDDSNELNLSKQEVNSSDVDASSHGELSQAVDKTNTKEVKSTSEQIINGDILPEKDSSELSKQELNSNDVDASSNSLHGISQVVDKTNTNEVELIKSTSEQIINRDIPSEEEFNSSEVVEESSQIVQSIDEMNTKEIEHSKSTSEQNVLPEKSELNIDKQEANPNGVGAAQTSLHEELSQIVQMETNEIEQDLSSVNDITAFIYKIMNEGRDPALRKQHTLDYFSNNNIDSQETYNWLLNNQTDPNAIFLLGYFNYLGIETSVDYKKAFNLFINPLMQEHTLAQYYSGVCYCCGQGTKKNEKLAIEYYRKAADKNFTAGQTNVGYCYEVGMGVKKDMKMAIHWYEQAVNNGSLVAMYNLGRKYKNGEGIDKDYKKAFELYEKSAEGGFANGIAMLGYCYEDGIGTNADMQKAFELYQKAADLDNDLAQHNLANMYENGGAIVKRDIDKAIYWYKKSADQGYQKAQIGLKKLLKETKK